MFFEKTTELVKNIILEYKATSFTSYWRTSCYTKSKIRKETGKSI